MRINRFFVVAALLAAAFALTLRPSHAYVEAPMSFGAIVAQSTNILLMRVEQVDRQNNIIVYRKIKDLKGTHPQQVIKHNIGRGGLRPNEWKPQMDWAEPGKVAAFFHNGGASETCIGNWWYQAYGGGEWWNHSHGEPYLNRSYSGSPEKLASIIPPMLEGKEVIVPCMVNGNLEDLHQRKAKIQRLKVSLKLQDYNPKRDFVGWGGEDFRRVNGLAGFTHISSLTRVDPEAQAISVVDFDGDGKADICLVGGGRIVIMQNNGDSLSEVTLPGVAGARSAVWADYNGDGKPDLLLATPSGPRLFTNAAGGLRDDSHLLPTIAGSTLTAAAWLDYDGDGKPDILLANGYHGLRVLRNVGMQPPSPAAPKGAAFTDVSKQVGLGEDGLAANVKFDCLSVSDVNADGRLDVLYGNLLLINSKNAKNETSFTLAKDSSLAFTPGRINPVFGDYDNDGHPDLFVPQKGRGLLFHNEGNGKFTEVSAKSGDLAQSLGWATSGVWGDFDNDGQLDLVIGCLKGCNRFFRNKGDGTFEDATAKIGLDQRIFNTQAVSLVDINNDGVLDMVFNNEGQDSVIMLGSSAVAGKHIPLTLNVAGKEGVVGSRVQVLSKDGKLLATRDISGGDGRGGQQPPTARFTLEPGTYKVQVRYSTGQVRSKEVTLGESPMRSSIDEKTE